MLVETIFKITPMLAFLLFVGFTSLENRSTEFQRHPVLM